ncbi:MAG: helix-turn-helix transcriptional regulator [Oscillospiraceae bacterium]|nr:helix-turn-helix transcriptional regulator [Oscillospiraceae bacterium]
MNPILQRLLDIMSEKEITAKKVTEDCNMSASSFTDWKKGKASPGVEAISKLSDYFHVSTDYLIKGREFERDPEPDTEDASDDQPDVQQVPPANYIEFSNPVETELLAKFRRLPPEYQGKAFSYIDGMLAVLPLAGEGKESVRSIS